MSLCRTDTVPCTYAEFQKARRGRLLYKDFWCLLSVTRPQIAPQVVQETKDRLVLAVFGLEDTSDAERKAYEACLANDAASGQPLPSRILLHSAIDMASSGQVQEGWFVAHPTIPWVADAVPGLLILNDHYEVDEMWRAGATNGRCMSIYVVHDKEPRVCLFAYSFRCLTLHK